jgi:hypothetical protein
MLQKTKILRVTFKVNHKNINNKLKKLKKKYLFYSYSMKHKTYYYFYVNYFGKVTEIKFSVEETKRLESAQRAF